MKKSALPWLLLALSPAPALAHTSTSHIFSFAAGTAHPGSGLDHLLVLVAAGAWLALIDRAMAAKLGAAMMLALGLGILLGGSVAALPLEVLITVSLVAVGVGVAQSRYNAPALIGAALVAVGLVHGLVHGAEMAAGAWVFASGVVLGSMLILVSSTLVFKSLKPYLRPAGLRVFGCALAALGVLAGF